MTSLETFTLFPLLPFDLRRKIWIEALPGPRALRIIRNKPKGFVSYVKMIVRTSTPPPFKTCPASYGGHQPAILSVTRESRNEALIFLTFLLGTYWNLKIDTPYFEISGVDCGTDELMLLGEARKHGVLDHFLNIAIDWLIWDLSRQRPSTEYEHPIETLNLLPNIKSCTFVPVLHTNQKDLIKEYEPWSLGPLTPTMTLPSRDLFKRVEGFAWSDISRDRWRIIPDREINFLVIHGRNREPLVIKEIKRRRKDVPGQHDFFG